MFEVKFSRQAEKFLSKCDDELFYRIEKKISDLKVNPVSHDTKRLKGYEIPTFRVRVGSYRILYEIRQAEELIIVVIVDKRSQVYG